MPVRKITYEYVVNGHARALVVTGVISTVNRDASSSLLPNCNPLVVTASVIDSADGATTSVLPLCLNDATETFMASASA